MLRSSETRTATGRTPRSTSARAAKRIMTSGPQTNAVVAAGSVGRPSSAVVTTPTWPVQPAAARSTVTRTSSPAARQAGYSVGYSRSAGVRAPMSTATRPKRDRSATAWRITGRSGARPIPPATTIRSPPVGTRQSVPNGPRMPSTSPVRAPESAADTAPTDRTVCTIPAPSCPLTETGTSPTPNAYVIVNWPGSGATIGSSTGSSTSVAVSAVSTTRRRTRYRDGITTASGTGPAAASGWPASGPPRR